MVFAGWIFWKYNLNSDSNGTLKIFPGTFNPWSLGQLNTRLKNKMGHLRARLTVFKPFFARVLTVLTR